MKSKLTEILEVKLPHDKHEQLKKRAAVEHSTVPALVRKACQEFIDRHKQEKEFVCIVTFDGSHRDHRLGWYRGRIVHESEKGRRFVTLKESLEIYASIFEAPSNPDAHYGDGKEYVKWLRMAAAAIR